MAFPNHRTCMWRGEASINYCFHLYDCSWHLIVSELRLAYHLSKTSLHRFDQSFKDSPHQGAFSRLKHHFTPICDRYRLMSCWSTIKGLAIIRQNLVWEFPPCTKTLETPDESGSGQIWYNVYMYHTATCSLHLEGSGEVNSSTWKGWFFLHTEWW